MIFCSADFHVLTLPLKKGFICDCSQSQSNHEAFTRHSDFSRAQIQYKLLKVLQTSAIYLCRDSLSSIVRNAAMLQFCNAAMLQCYNSAMLKAVPGFRLPGLLIISINLTISTYFDFSISFDKWDAVGKMRSPVGVGRSPVGEVRSPVGGGEARVRQGRSPVGEERSPAEALEKSGWGGAKSGWVGVKPG
jgi:hypothetical protein